MGNGNRERGMGMESKSLSPLPHSPLPSFFACLLLAVLSVTAQRAPGLSREEKWRGDMQYLFVELPKRHKTLFFKITRQQFDREIAGLIELVPEDFRLGDQIGAPASDGDDRRPAHQNFVQRRENLSPHALSIF